MPQQSKLEQVEKVAKPANRPKSVSVFSNLQYHRHRCSIRTTDASDKLYSWCFTPKDTSKNNDATTLAKPKEIREIIHYLPNNKAPGKDGVTNLKLKNSSRKAIVAFTYIINACIVLSYFPDKWQAASMLPIWKPGKPVQDVTPYRPVSLLSALSKVFVRIILTRLNKHIEANNLIPDFQFGFRKEHSATHQLLRVIKQVKTSFDHSQSTGMVLQIWKLKLNAAKSESVFFTRRRVQRAFPRKQIQVDGLEIPWNRGTIYRLGQAT